VYIRDLGQVSEVSTSGAGGVMEAMEKLAHT